MTVTSSLVSQLGLILGSVATLAGVVITVRASKASNQRTAVLNEISSSRDAWRDDAASLRTNLKEAKDEYEKELRCLEEKFDKHMKECRAEREKWANDRFTMQSRINAITLWCRQVYPFLKESGKEVPEPPPGVLERQ